jgi:hypothetical protein
MKITGIKAEDFDRIERAFGYIIGEQLLRARSYAQSGEVEKCEAFLDSARDMIETFKKIQKAERGYKTKRIKERLSGSAD